MLVVLVAWFGNDVRSYVVNKGLDWLLGQQETLSDRDIERIVQAMDKASKNKLAEKHVKDVYRELETDRSITGVAAVPNEPMPVLKHQLSRIGRRPRETGRVEITRN